MKGQGLLHHFSGTNFNDDRQCYVNLVDHIRPGDSGWNTRYLIAVEHFRPINTRQKRLVLETLTNEVLRDINRHKSGQNMWSDSYLYEMRQEALELLTSSVARDSPKPVYEDINIDSQTQNNWFRTRNCFIFSLTIAVCKLLSVYFNK